MQRASGPIRLTPSPRPKVWGKTKLSPWFPDSAEPVGEVWYELEPKLPLLVKLLFTADRLSIQVHPDDGEGVDRGKTEMWHILEAEPGASIGLGFRRELTPDELAEACATGEIEHLVKWFPVKAGETYFTPAHTVHAIGGGIVLCEIQQNSDVTYRLWDYGRLENGRPRELHVEQALPICDAGVHSGASEPVHLGEGHALLVRSPHFITETVRLVPGASFGMAPEPSQLLICLEGRGLLADHPVAPGEVWHLPPEAGFAEVRAETPLRFLRTYTP